MDIQFCIQDPTNLATTYLYEAILTAVNNATSWRGIYAFASRNGVVQLIEDSVVHEFLSSGGIFDLVVGVDAVTNRQTLERLREIEQRNHSFRPRVFWNDTNSLFHPKLSEFTYPDGRRRLIIGSGNLTPGGLMRNFEAYTILSCETEEDLDMSALNAFFERHNEQIKIIDDDALERADQNIFKAEKSARQIKILIPQIENRNSRLLSVSQPAQIASSSDEPIMIAQVPRAGGRWAQAHFNTEVIRDYFHVTNLRVQRVFFTHVSSSGNRSDIEVRQVVFSSTTNRNHKIEIGAARGLDYPSGGVPILVFRERQLRTFDYMLLMPDKDGYTQLLDATKRMQSRGKGLPRIITSLYELGKIWPSCPLLSESDDSLYYS